MSGGHGHGSVSVPAVREGAPMKKPLRAGLQLFGAFLFAGLCIALAMSKIDLARVWPAWLTVSLFGPLCWYTKRLWHQKVYWLIVMAALVFHLFVLLAVNRVYPSLPLATYLILAFLEAGLVLLLLVSFCKWPQE